MNYNERGERVILKRDGRRGWGLERLTFNLQRSDWLYLWRYTRTEKDVILLRGITLKKSL
jgi:hypothetical protein